MRHGSPQTLILSFFDLHRSYRFKDTLKRAEVTHNGECRSN